jgi:hypothetical protein
MLGGEGIRDARRIVDETDPRVAVHADGCSRALYSGFSSSRNRLERSGPSVVLPMVLRRVLKVSEVVRVEPA